MSQITSVYLAPMEGLADPPLRKVLCPHGGYDWCFSEFIRVTDEGLSEKTLVNDCPELLNGGYTQDGTPCRVQLLGDNPKLMADAAKKAARLGALGVDLNFGCPSRFVHHSGSMLLKEPELLHDITACVRQELDPKVLLSVKIRCGFADKKELPSILDSVALSGVSEVIVHCRTRSELYRADALDWSVLKPMAGLYPGVVLVANGDINNAEDAQKCRELSGCEHVMCGRGGFMLPNIGKVLKNGEKPYNEVQTLMVMREVAEEFVNMGIRREKIILDRTKQFLSYARLGSPNLREFFKKFCRCASVSECFEMIDRRIKSAELGEVL